MAVLERRYCIRRAGIVGDLQVFDRPDFIALHQRKTRVGAADVGDDSPHSRLLSGRSSSPCRYCVPPPRRDEIGIPPRGGFRICFSGGVVDINETEALRIAGSPFEIVEQRPNEIAADVDSAGPLSASLRCIGLQNKRPPATRCASHQSSTSLRSPAVHSNNIDRQAKAVVAISSKVSAESAGNDRPADVGSRYVVRRGAENWPP